MNAETKFNWAEWQARNPLRQWRKMSGMTLYEIGARIGVGNTTIQKWESGTTFPTEVNMLRLQSMMKQSDLETVWRNWFEEPVRE